MVRDHFAYTLNMPAAREIVAELLFCGSLIPQVTWTRIGGYNENNTLLGTGSQNAYLLEEVFGLSADPNDYAGTGWGFDTRGRPQLVWKADRNPSTVRTVAALKAQPKESFHDEERECDIAERMEFGTAASHDYVLFVNGKTAVTSKYHVAAADTVIRVGGYGRQVEIFTLEDIDSQFPWQNTLDYDNNAENEFTRLGGDVIVMIDTYLAKVVKKTEAVKDPAGHVITLNGLSGVGGSGVERWAYTLPQVAVPTMNNGILTENTHVFSLTKLDARLDPGRERGDRSRVGAAGQYVFTVNFAGTANNAMGTPSGRLTTKAGTTYNFSITTASLSGLVTLSSGSFTMA